MGLIWNKFVWLVLNWWEFSIWVWIIGVEKLNLIWEAVGRLLLVLTESSKRKLSTGGALGTLWKSFSWLWDLQRKNKKKITCVNISSYIHWNKQNIFTKHLHFNRTGRITYMLFFTRWQYFFVQRIFANLLCW